MPNPRAKALQSIPRMGHRYGHCHDASARLRDGHAQFGVIATSDPLLARLRAAMNDRLLADRTKPGGA